MHRQTQMNIKENSLQPSSLNINIKHGYLNNKPTQSILTLANSVLLNIVLLGVRLLLMMLTLLVLEIGWRRRKKKHCCCKHFLIGFRIKYQDLYEFILRENLLKLKAIRFFGIVENFMINT